MAYSHQQLDTARTIIAVGNSVGASRKQIKAALLTALGEANLNPNAVNKGSGATGWRQEIKSSYPTQNRRDPAGQARRFYAETKGMTGKSYDIANRVQRAGVGTGYLSAKAGEAGQLMRNLGAAGGSGSARRGTALGGYGGSAAPSYGVQKGRTTTDLDAALIDALLSGGKNPVTRALSAADQGLYTTTSEDKLVATASGPQPETSTGSAGGGSAKLGKGADRAGVSTKPVVLKFVSKIAALYGQPLTIGTGTHHTRMTVNGNVSDHWSGHAADIPATGHTLIRLGQLALIAAGMNEKQARAQTGGLFNVNGHQIIFNTHEGGDHTNHLHVSAY